MGLVTERTNQGYRLRFVVSEPTWDRLQRVSDAMGIQDREVLEVALALGLRYFDMIVNPLTPEVLAQIRQAYQARADQESRELLEQVAGMAGAST